MRTNNYTLLFFLVIFFISGNFKLYMAEPLLPIEKRDKKKVFAHISSKLSELVMSFSTYDKKKLRRILEEAAEKLNQRDFTRFIFLRDEMGWTILKQNVVENNLDNVNLIFDIVEDKYNYNPYLIYNFVSAVDYQGQGALYVAVMRKNIDMVELLLRRAAEAFGHRKDLFYQFISQKEYINGYTPLILATFNYDFETVELMVETIAKILGRNSSLFIEFLNEKSDSGYSAYFYAKPLGKKLLESFGATPMK